MPEIGDSRLFSLLPEPRPPWKEFVFSMGTQGVALAALLSLGVFHPEILTKPIKDYKLVPLVSVPATVNHQPQPLRELAHRPEILQALPVPRESLRAPVTPAIKEVVAPKIVAAAAKPPVLSPSTPVIPRELVKTNVFSTGSSAPQTIAKAPQQVQTGGFGDPNGVPAQANNTGKPANIAQLGSFDLPGGEGNGNGTGGAKGARGVVASAGFGNGTAIGDGSARTSASRGTVRQGGFGDMEPAAAPAKKAAEIAPAKMVPAEITSKPNPVYTEEARKLHIEGEVLLEVVLEASGQLRVVRVVRGLGHGLDESAARAAEQIRFKPALRDGQPADSKAVLHIIFQLA